MRATREPSLRCSPHECELPNESRFDISTRVRSSPPPRGSGWTGRRVPSVRSWVQRWTSAEGRRALGPCSEPPLWSVSTAVQFLKPCECEQTHLLKGMLGAQPSPIQQHQEIQLYPPIQIHLRGISGNLRSMSEHFIWTPLYKHWWVAVHPTYRIYCMLHVIVGLIYFGHNITYKSKLLQR